MRKQLAVLLTVAPLLAYSVDSVAQSTSDYLQKKDRSLTEVVIDRGERQLLDLDEIISMVGGWISDAKDWAVNTYERELLEFRLDKTLNLAINDPEVREYLANRYPPIEPDAEVIAFSPTRDSAYVQVHYDIHFDDAEIVKQYLLGLDGSSATSILGVGDEWAERYGNKISIEELFKVIKLEKTFEERWEERRLEHLGMNPDELFEYEKNDKAFDVLANYVKGYNPSGDPVVIANDASRAQIGVTFVIKDIYGNIKDDITCYDIEQYVATPEGWLFDETIYSSKWKEGILIGMEKNRFQDDGFWDKAKIQFKQWFDDAVEYIRD